MVSEIKDVRTIRRKVRIGKIAAICRYSEGNNNFIPKNLLLSKQKDDNSSNLRHSEALLSRKNPVQKQLSSKEAKQLSETVTPDCDPESVFR